jgi:hypothetical protein
VKQRINLNLKRKDYITNRQWLFSFLERSDEVQATTLAVCFWHIWEARNDARNSVESPNPTRVCHKILAYVHLIKENLFKCTPAPRCEPDNPVPKWCPPPPGVIQINSDAAIFESANRMGAGIVARDHLGTCVFACRHQLLGLASPEVAEALALHRAVTLASEVGYEKVIFASDCLSLVQRIISSRMDRILRQGRSWSKKSLGSALVSKV